MEHTCHHCNATVEDGVPFCPKCGAPQIRVAAPDDDEAGPAATPTGASQPAFGGQPPWQQSPDFTPGRINWRAAFPGALAAGIVGGGLSLLLGRFLPILLLCLILAGALAVRIYRGRTKAVVRPAMGAKVGAFAGLFCFLVDALAVIAMFVLERPMIQESMREAMKISGRNADPQSLEIMKNMIDKLNTPDGMVVFCVLILAFLFALSLIFTSLGGLLAAAMFGKDRNVA